MSGAAFVPRPPRHSSEEAVAALDEACQRLGGFDPHVSLEWVDGWLAALACAPLRLPPETWLEAMFGDAFERAFADPPDRAQALSAIEARLDVLRDQLDAETLLDHPGDLRLDPVLFEWSDEDRERAVQEHGFDADEALDLQVGAVWAEGVLEGMAALPALGIDAADLDPDAEAQHGELMAQIEALLLREGSDEWKAFVAQYHPGQSPTRDDLVAEACYALQELRIWWLDHAPRPEPRRVEATPGRNDPCPCGSGKKFKKCHGASR